MSSLAQRFSNSEIREQTPKYECTVCACFSSSFLYRYETTQVNGEQIHIFQKHKQWGQPAKNILTERLVVLIIDGQSHYSAKNLLA